MLFLISIMGIIRGMITVTRLYKIRSLNFLWKNKMQKNISQQYWKNYIEILQAVVKPALGCTEPIAGAYAAAIARDLLGCMPDRIQVFVSDNLYKNSMGVFVPGTGKIGLGIAVAAGTVAGDAKAGLQVLENIKPIDVEIAKTMLANNQISISHSQTDEFIFCRIQMSKGNHTAEVTISGGHTRVTEKILDGEKIFSVGKGVTTSTSEVCDGANLSIENIYDFSLNVPLDDISFILEADRLNLNLSKEGMSKSYGLSVGRTMHKEMQSGLIGDALMSQVIMQTAAASDARMGGASLPAMSNFGSGNQGIAATIPVSVTALHFNATQEQLARALIMSHLGAIYIKSFYPALSAFCGNTVTSAAASMAMVYLAGGNFEQSCFAIQNVLSDSAGMVCDGAKSSCAMKVSTSSGASVRSMILALNDIHASDQGIVAADVEQTIRNIGKMVREGMSTTDATIIKIMS